MEPGGAGRIQEVLMVPAFSPTRIDALRGAAAPDESARALVTAPLRGEGRSA